MKMRVIVSMLAIAALLALLGHPAVASCAPPAALAENASRATAVVYGAVTSAGSGSVTVRVDRVLKGSLGPSVIVFLGPGRGGTGGAVMLTSVDYSAAVGSDHVLYLISGADGELETNACIGSHVGQPTPAEAAFFGAGVAPQAPPSAALIGAAWPWLIALAAGTVALYLLRRGRGTTRDTS